MSKPSRREGAAGKRRKNAPPLLLVNIGQLLTLRWGRPGPRRGPALGDVGLIEDGAVLCAGGKIVSAGTTREALRDPWVKENKKKVREIDCAGQVVLPGFVDSHTHPVFMGPRLVDFEKRIGGAGYEQIAAAGGGIRSSMEAVRQASPARLAEKVLATLREMSAHGTTTVEAKSGYGLSLEAEIKSLEAIRAAGRRWAGTVVPTLLGAHVLPPEYLGRSQEYVRLVCTEMIPRASQAKLAAFVDVFCDRGAFSVPETETIFAAAAAHHLGVRAHVCQLTPSDLASLLKFHPASFDHLDCVSDSDVAALGCGETVATLVPGANYFLGLEHYPPARKLIDAGVPVALATDYNPGTSPTPSMAMVLSLACTHLKMSPEEAIAAATLNGAAALGLEKRKGSIEAGKDADLAVFAVDDYREVAYWFGVNRCIHSIIGGEVQQSHEVGR